MNSHLIFDASTLISLAMAGLVDDLRQLKKISKGKFIITQDVKKEAIDKPLTIKRFELEGIKLKELLDEKVLELPASIGVDDKLISKRTEEILNMANSLFIGNGKEIHLIDLGETSCLALSKILEEKGISSVIAVDERTTRSLSETPKDLKNFLERKLHTQIKVNQKSVDFFSKFKFIRSIELIYVAYKKGILRSKDTHKLEALLYSLKYKGASISGKEIKEIIRMV